MPRRLIAALALVVASSLAACAESVTAPSQPLAPSSPRHNTVEPSTCRGGFVLSEGRCS